jgi:hypothetical protein
MSRAARTEVPDSARGIAASPLVIHGCFTLAAGNRDLLFTPWQAPAAAGKVSGAGLDRSVTHAASQIPWTTYYSCFFVFGSLVAAHLRETRSFLACLGSWLGFLLLVSGLLVFQAHWSQWHAREWMVAGGSMPIMAALFSRGSFENALPPFSPRYLGKILAMLFERVVTLASVVPEYVVTQAGCNTRLAPRLVLQGELL